MSALRTSAPRSCPGSSFISARSIRPAP
jgi:hypothetical protein